jgi:hypothetical protein
MFSVFSCNSSLVFHFSPSEANDVEPQTRHNDYVSTENRVSECNILRNTQYVGSSIVGDGGRHGQKQTKRPFFSASPSSATKYPYVRVVSVVRTIRTQYP